MQIRFLPLYLLLFFSGCQLFIPLEKRLLSDDDKTRLAALDKAVHMPVEGQEKLIPFLKENLEQPDSRTANRAADALVVLGSPSVAAFMDSARSPDIYVRLVAIGSLGRLGDLARPALPALLAALQDSHPLVREEAAHALGDIGVLDSNVKDALKIAATADRVDTVRIAALEALQSLEISRSQS